MLQEESIGETRESTSGDIGATIGVADQAEISLPTNLQNLWRVLLSELTSIVLT